MEDFLNDCSAGRYLLDLLGVGTQDLRHSRVAPEVWGEVPTGTVEIVLFLVAFLDILSFLYRFASHFGQSSLNTCTSVSAWSGFTGFLPVDSE